MERTLIQLKSDFADMADKHKQINSFFWGNFVDAINQDAVDYPLMCCTLQPSQIGDSYTGVDLQVIICDKYNEQDYRMIDEVHSDMLRILKDIDVTLKQFRFQDYLDVETDFSTEPFINEGQDITAGWGGVMRMRVHDYENRCAIPYDGFDFDGSTTGTGCSDANYIVQYENGTLIEQGTIPSGGSVTVEVPDVIICQDANYTLTDSLGNVLDSGTIASGGSATITAPDATVNVNKSDSTLIQAVTVASGGVEPYNVADSVITVNSASYTSLLATDSLNVPVVDSNGDAVATTVVGSDVQVDDLPCASGASIGKLLLKTGTKTSAATGDDGNIQAGRAVDELILDGLNPFGNKWRFTGTSGGYYDHDLSGFYDVNGAATTYALAFPNGNMIDWSTYNNTLFLMYNIESFMGDTWTNILNTYNSATYGGFTGWRLFNVREALNLSVWVYGNINVWDYEPLISSSLNLTSTYFTSTARFSSQIRQIKPDNPTVSIIGPTLVRGGLAVRTTNISELTI